MYRYVKYKDESIYGCMKGGKVIEWMSDVETVSG
jgi:hypothetical protein